MGFFGRGGAVGAVLKSIQKGNIQNVTTAWEEAAITGVDIDKTFLLYNAFGASSGVALYNLPLVALKNSTTVHAYCRDNTPRIYFTVVEFESGIKSVQRAVTTIEDEANPKDVTITEVNLAKSFISWLGQAFLTQDDVQFREMRSIYLLNSTTLRMDAQAPLYDDMISWEVVEFE